MPHDVQQLVKEELECRIEEKNYHGYRQVLHDVLTSLVKHVISREIIEYIKKVDELIFNSSFYSSVARDAPTVICTQVRAVVRVHWLINWFKGNHLFYREYSKERVVKCLRFLLRDHPALLQHLEHFKYGL